MLRRCCPLLASLLVAEQLAALGSLGLGFGMFDFTIKVRLSVCYGERSAAMLNLLSAGFGPGAVLAPLAVGRAGSTHFLTGSPPGMARPEFLPLGVFILLFRALQDTLSLRTATQTWPPDLMFPNSSGARRGNTRFICA